jgi:hypothetical protein
MAVHALILRSQVRENLAEAALEVEIEDVKRPQARPATSHQSPALPATEMQIHEREGHVLVAATATCFC